jgi:tripartite-type tricarboxylate transporter receptor subunit TctC
MSSTVSQAQYVRSGRMRALALTGDKRSRSMPDTPTLKEQGIDVVAYAWWAILAPARTSKSVIDKLHAELVKLMLLPDVDRMLTETLGMDVAALSPEETQKWILDEAARWGKVVRDNNVRAQ